MTEPETKPDLYEQVLAGHPDALRWGPEPPSWRQWTRWQIPEAPLRDAYAPQIAQAEADAYAEDAARSRQQRPTATAAPVVPAEPLPAPEQVAAQVTADEAAHAGETLPAGQDWFYKAPPEAPAEPDAGGGQ